MIIFKIYNPDEISISFYDEFGNQYLEPPAGSEVLEAPYTLAQAMDALRLERDNKLLASDWTQLPDVPLSSPDVMQWRAYRQELRNFPELVEIAGWGYADWPDPPQ
jgi:hypothetical protein